THDDGERLGEQQVLVRGGAGRGPAAARRNPHELGEATVHVDPHGRTREAEVPVPFSAKRTRAAGEVRLDDDALAALREPADQLVTHDARIPDRALAAPDAVVGATETRERHLDEYLVGARLGRCYGLDAQVARAVENRGFHG